MNDHPIRLPWVGPRYDETRILIMGESHHCDPADEFSYDLTLRTVRDAQKGMLQSSFFDDIKDAILGDASEGTSSEEFWNRFAFANFCQGAVIREEGMPLSDASTQMLQAGEQALPTILSLLKPRKLLLFSKRAWRYTHNLPAITRHEPEKSVPCPDGKLAETYFYASDELSFAVSCIALYHPSAWTKFHQNASYWHPVIQTFLTDSTRSRH
ncbi:hypothetical protein [Novacetimonas pomaceti]|uniref:Uncharacterized protein n=1 Tax=Novacetimonas pomaceti TaxID=2021998 RepID=A0A318Q8C6_9PROT|nr:hypothetical protein [Novacetimonas pomaceti]PYD75000.1 hypothetical protein CFR71_11475 [Novacetimonas pomaceti]